MKQYKPMLKLKSRRLESGMTQAELAEDKAAAEALAKELNEKEV